MLKLSDLMAVVARILGWDVVRLMAAVNSPLMIDRGVADIFLTMVVMKRMLMIGMMMEMYMPLLYKG
jgi:hypothetical protein